jgi:hypothetical protein
VKKRNTKPTASKLTVLRQLCKLISPHLVPKLASIDWAQHRRREAAAKLHVRLDLHSLLPRFVLVESAKAADSIRTAEVCAGSIEPQTPRASGMP